MRRWLRWQLTRACCLCSRDLTSNREETAADDVGYVLTGPVSEPSADCKRYEPSPENPDVGKCMGFDVQASASCNYLEKKEED